MSLAAPPMSATTPTRRGRGLVIAGSILLALSVVGGIVGTALTLGSFDVGALQRDVVISGPRSALIPGTIDFRVDEPIDPDDDAEMTVGIATDDPTAVPDCTLTTGAGEEIGLLGAVYDATLLNDSTGLYSVVATARLGPGDYVASCEYRGEPSGSAGGNFTVGRTFGNEDVGEFLGPVLGFGAVVSVCGLLFVLGLVLLIVGLVKGSRSRRNPPGPWPPGPGYAPPTGPAVAPPAAYPPVPPVPPVIPPVPPGTPLPPRPTSPPVGPAPTPPTGGPPAPPPAGGPDVGWPGPPG